jgi:hypothetical protein
MTKVATKPKWKQGNDVMIFKIFSPKNWQKIAFFRKLHTANISKNSIIILVFEKKQLFRPKLSKIAENCDHNIGPVQSS